MIRVAISGCHQSWLLPLDCFQMRRALERMLDGAPEAEREVELCLIRDAAMARLNRRHLGCVGPTNVLAFPAGDGEKCGRTPGPETPGPETPGPEKFGKIESLGSLVLCVDAVRREAMLYGQPETAYCLSLLAHGVAHLMGHEHGPVMDALCEELLHAAGQGIGFSR